MHHFNDGGYLLDSGWFAYLLASSDPWLPNPQSIHTETFYQHHISPIISVWGLLASGVLGIPAIDSFALYTGVCGVLVFLPFAIVGLNKRYTPPTRLLIVVMGGLFALSSEFLFGVLGFPHYEIAFVGISGTLYLALRSNAYWFAIPVAFAMTMVREDGGFFVAYVALCALATNSTSLLERQNRFLWFLVGSGILFSCAALLIKYFYFPGFGTVRGNFVGDNYNHLTVELVLSRLRNIALSASVLPVILLMPLIILRVWKTVFPVLFMTPLLALQITSVRDVIGNFELHYVIPLAIVVVIILLQMMLSLASSNRRNLDLLLIFVLVVVASAPFSGALGLRQNSNWHFNRFAMAPWPQKTFDLDQAIIREVLAREKGNICRAIG